MGGGEQGRKTTRAKPEERRENTVGKEHGVLERVIREGKQGLECQAKEMDFLCGQWEPQEGTERGK